MIEDFQEVDDTIDPQHVLEALGARIPPERLMSYLEMRAAGQSMNMAELLATRTFPGVRTDSTFLRGSHTQFADHPKLGRIYRKMAEDEGVNITGQKYLRSLARYPGDPEAWVSSRGEVERRCLERGWSCEGAVEVRAPRYRDPMPDTELADDLVAEYALPGETREETLARVGPHAEDTHSPMVQPIPPEAEEFCPDKWD